MNRKVRILLLAFIALSIAVLIVLVFVHSQTRNSYKVTFTGEKKAGGTIQKAHYSGNKGGRIEWELDAESATRSKDQDLTILQSVKAVFYSKSGRQYVLTSKEGRYRESINVIDAFGDVDVQTPEGYTLKSDSLKFVVKTKEITSESHVRIESKGVDIEGTGLLIRVDEETLRVNKKVKAIFRGAAL